jgi:hypothetical protein
VKELIALFAFVIFALWIVSSMVMAIWPVLLCLAILGVIVRIVVWWRRKRR